MYDSPEDIDEYATSIFSKMDQAIKLQIPAINKVWNNGFLNFEKYCDLIINDRVLDETDPDFQDILEKAKIYLNNFKSKYSQLKF